MRKLDNPLSLDTEGNVTEVYGRKLNDNLRKGTPRICIPIAMA